MIGEALDNKNLFKNIFVRAPVHLQRGQKIMFEGEEAEIISVKPFLVIKTKSGIVCGDLGKRFEHIKE